MPVGPGAGPDAVLVRRVRVVRGQLPLEVECRPAFDYARARHVTEVNECGARFDGPGLSLGLAASVPLRPDGDGVVAAFPLGEGQSATFVLRLIAPDAHPGRCPGTEEAGDWFRETVDYWQRWAARCTYRGRWREVVLRSALALKLLTYDGQGFWLCHKRLSQGRFSWWPSPAEGGAQRLAAHQLAVLLSAGDPSRTGAAADWRPVGPPT